MFVFSFADLQFDTFTVSCQIEMKENVQIFEFFNFHVILNNSLK